MASPTTSPVNAAGAAALSKPLCVDLDGTLVRTDLFLEALLALLRRSPVTLLLLPLWLLRGRAYLKQKVAEQSPLDITLLPYHTDLLQYLAEEQKAGRQLVLATAANRKFADQVAEHLGLFDEVFASDSETNLKGRRKLHALRQRFGSKGFTYAADAFADLPVWREAAGAILVNTPPFLAGLVRRRQIAIDRLFPETHSRFTAFLRALRPHQWTKNLLLFVPLLLSHKLGDLSLLADALSAFVSFTLCAAGVYILNDLMDLEADRAHPSKRFRPFAAGALPVSVGIVAVPLLTSASFGLALLHQNRFLLVLACYWILTLTYSLHFKKVAFVDVVMLAGLYTLRILAGGAAMGIVISFYTLAFAIFLFLSLALVKRFSELHRTAQQKTVVPLKGRAYLACDITPLAAHGIASGYVAVLVMALYLNSPEVTVLYRQPEWLWLICPLLLYWIGRVWMLAYRGEMNEDPVIFALRDRVSHFLGVLALFIIYLGS